MGWTELVTVAGSEAVGELERLRGRFAKTGLYPLLLGDAEEVERLEEGLEDEVDPAVIVANSRRIDAERWLLRQAELEPEIYNAQEGDWPEGEPPALGLITHLDARSQKPKDQVFLGLFRVDHPWEVFAHLGWGGWNDCPGGDVHCSVHRYWQETYGAEVVSVTGAVVQCVVARPPRDRKSSHELARQQYHYCYDIVDQGVETISALAACVLGTRYWFFWWD